MSLSRAKFLAGVPKAVACARALQQAEEATTGFRALKMQPRQFEGKRALVLGSGVAGLTTAYELLKQQSGMRVTVLEAHGKTGGRCLSLRTGDSLTEDKNSELKSKPGETQTVRFEHVQGDEEPYLNAGPGRIPSSHKRVLSYLKEFGVDIQVYVMNSQSNLVQMEGGPHGEKPIVYRRLDHNTRGWLAEYLHGKAEDVVRDHNFCRRKPLDPPQEGEEEECEGSSSKWGAFDDEAVIADKADKLRSFLVSFGDLTEDGTYVPNAGKPGLENASSDRSGFTELPGIAAGKTAPPIAFDKLIHSEFWSKTRFYQPQDFLWQPTSFQPVGGMDQVEKAFATQVASLGGTVLLNHPVKSIDWDDENKEFVVLVQKIGTAECDEFRCDYLFSNIAMPFLETMVTEKCMALFDTDFSKGLQAVYKAQNEGKADEFDPSFQRRFLANTTKVGWQADRILWEGTSLQKYDYDRQHQDPPEHEIGVVPIFGGISWTQHPIGQIWYPSTGYHDQKGILTGCYNFSQNAKEWGTWSVQKRLDEARCGAKQLSGSDRFANGLENGVAIAWQNMPYIKGGWGQWDVVDESVKHFNNLAQGTAIKDSSTAHPVFFVVGDQLSSLPGWQEGAVASALNAINRLAHPRLAIPHLFLLPDTRLMVEGV